MKALVWHWGRRGAGPLFAARLATALGELQGCTARLSLAAGAEILAASDAPACDWRELTYETSLGYVLQRLASPFLLGRTRAQLARERPDIAICAMPALLDSRMVAGLRREGIGYAVVVHDAEAHPGDGLSFNMLGQHRLLRGARILFPLSQYVEASLLRQGFGAGGQRVVKLWHPPFSFAAAPPEPNRGGRPRMLYFGRLLPYKGLDLLAGALERLGPDRPFELRVCGDGPNSSSLERLKKLPGVAVEQRWFNDTELPGLLAWADALVLPYREASQSGVASMAIAAGRYVLATNVGGLPEQLGGLPHALLCAPSAEAIAEGLMQLAAQVIMIPVVAPVDAAADWRAMAGAMREALERK
jgi:glycosyltransferase involved in cell wall biosynthesis